MVCGALAGVCLYELFVPEDVKPVAKQFGLVKGGSLDVTNGWDFTVASHRRAALDRIVNEEPHTVIRCPPCTPFSVLQNLNVARSNGDLEWMANSENALDEARGHARFCVDIYKPQLHHGRHFAHEHPWGGNLMADEVSGGVGER